jgi:group I intron endonuclease
MKKGIYIITNLLNGKKYIGQGVIQKRLTAHKWKSHNKHLRNAIEKDGKENFSFRPLVYCKDDCIDVLEAYFIKKYRSMEPEYGYNLESGGHRNKIISIEVRKKWSLKRKGRKISEEHKRNISKATTGEKHPMYGKNRKPIISEDLTVFFNTHKEAKNAGFNNAYSVARGTEKTCRKLKFRFATKQEIEERKQCQ